MRPLLLMALLAVANARDEQRAAWEQAEVELLHLDDRLRAATAQLRRLEQDQAAHLAELAAAEDQHARLRPQVARRLFALHRLRHRGFLPLLFSAENPHEFLRAARSLSWVLRHDRDLADRLAAHRSEVAVRHARLDADRQALLAAAGSLALAREAAAAKRAELAGQLGALPPQTQYSQRVIRGETPGSVDVRIDGRAPPPESDPVEEFEALRGRLPHPATGPAIGDGRGVAFELAPEASVVAVADGVVERIVAVAGFGNVCIVGHGAEWRTVYAWPEAWAVAPGATVRAGDPLGRLPRSATAPTRLHFELRRDRVPQDPQAWFAPEAGGRPG